MMVSKKVLVAVCAVMIIVILVVIGYTFLGGGGGSGGSEAHGKKSYPIVLGPIELPKAPHWDESNRCIYFVDVYQSTIHRYDPETKVHKVGKVGTGALAFVIPLVANSDKFIISYGSSLATVTWDGNSEKVNLRIIRPIDKDVYRANEGKVSPSGSLFVGTHSKFINATEIAKREAGLYAFYKDGSMKKLLTNVTVSNGMGWNRDGTKFYYIDSLAYTVESFSYNATTDALDDRKEVYNFQKSGIPGVPDGMAIDSEDKIWVTSFGGHQVLRIDPETGNVLRKIDVDANKITSAVFAGTGLNDFYIISGFYQNTEDDKKNYPHSGFIYQLSNFTNSGRPGVAFEIDSKFL